MAYEARTTCACGGVKSHNSAHCRQCFYQQRQVSITFTCKTCGVSVRRKRRGKDSRLFCSKRCAGADKRKVAIERRALCPPVEPRRCKCGAPCRRKYCSTSCAKHSQTTQEKQERRKTQRPTCQRVIVSKAMGRRKRFCSRVCMKASAAWRQMTKAGRRNRKAANRARLRGATCERVHVMDVFARDGWRCQLCGCPTPKRLRGQMVDQAPELDHIVPLACGGPHSYANTQCACRRCNGAKGAKPLGQQRLSLCATTRYVGGV